MRNLTEENLTEAVLDRLSECKDPRLTEIMTAMITHLHRFIRDIEPTEEEWFKGISFLTKTGQICDDSRQEFILLSDVLGVSMLADAINNRKPAGATETSVLGPFYVEGAPDRHTGADLAPGAENGVTISGTVKSVDGTPIKGATLDLWQTAPNGLYHMQDENQSEHNLCGKLQSGENGQYSFRTIKPVSYPVPTDGPVGDLLLSLGRHPFRPAHVHFIVSAPGFKPIVTQLFTEGDEYLDTDVVFGVKSSLVVTYQPQDNEWAVEYDFFLEPMT